MRLRTMRRSVSISRLAGAAARSRAAPLPFEVRPQAGEPGQQVFVLGQLHLRFGIGRLRPCEEDVQNQARAVEDAAGHRPLDVARSAPA